MRGPIFELFDLITGRGDIITVVISFFSVFVIIFVVFPIHECAHAFVARWLGDDTAERQGRLTLNPLRHIDPMGALAMCLCNIGWAKPTPVDIRKCRKTSMRTANVLVSIAGPLSNILLSLLFIIVEKLIVIVVGENITTTVFYVMLALNYTAQINIYLAVFNLIPVPPFDGYHVLASFLPAKAVAFMERNGRIIYWVVFFLIITRVLSVPLGIAANGIYWLLDKLTFFLG
ncbi:MAG: site-2 protease family protein [Oscillospiraceae bacterium]